MAGIKLNNKWGFIDEIGREIIPFKYEEISSSDTLIAVKFNDKWGFIDETDVIVVPLKYEDIISYRCCGANGAVGAVKLNGKWGTIGDDGKLLTDIIYDCIQTCDGYPYAVIFNGKIGALQDGKLFVSPKYDDIQLGGCDNNYLFSLMAVNINNKWGIVESPNKIFVPIKYNSSGEAFLFVPFSYFSKKYIEPKIEAWAQKGRYEKNEIWEKRIKEERETVIKALEREAKEKFIDVMSYWISFECFFNPDNYDTEKETHIIEAMPFGKLKVSVPIAEAETFEKEWKNITKTPKYTIDNDMFALEEVIFTLPNGKTYRSN